MYYEKNNDAGKLSAKSRRKQNEKVTALSKRQVLKRCTNDEYQSSTVVSGSARVESKYENDETCQFKCNVIISPQQR